ncbi:hypothetical protein QR680_000784 [Steinernema hermaphroditum]|uniref:Niemann-Pick C1 N-terminal domain-containing protein n=1 Tax=Steinernema hermaphroditum TaxID=289476 RepID=A0AA39LEP7_9BILA|nr:hypothetical protein QR680_000784 [Steinernema hermaphroditum]
MTDVRQLFCALCFLLTHIDAIKCYTGTETFMHIAPGNYSFCTYHPGTAHTSSLMDGHEEAQGFEFLANLFDAKNEMFQMDYICFHEKFTYPVDPTINEAIFEEMFRCVCGSDLCNDPKMFATYINDTRIKPKSSQKPSKNLFDMDIPAL